MMFLIIFLYYIFKNTQFGHVNNVNYSEKQTNKKTTTLQLTEVTLSLSRVGEKHPLVIVAGVNLSVVRLV